MKVGVIIYHKNIYDIHKERWVSKCLSSIKSQTFKDFAMFELCYSEQSMQLWENSIYFHQEMNNHVEATNFILDKAFDTCDIIFNVHLDDFYHEKRFEIQICKIRQGYDLVSSNFQLVTEDENGEDKLCQIMEMNKYNIKEEQQKEHNILAHPVIAYTKKFWQKNKYYNTDELGYEDFSMWKKAIENKEKIYILEDILLYYRIHDNQVGRTHRPP